VKYFFEGVGWTGVAGGGPKSLLGLATKTDFSKAHKSKMLFLGFSNNFIMPPTFHFEKKRCASKTGFRLSSLSEKKTSFGPLKKIGTPLKREECAPMRERLVPSGLERAVSASGRQPALVASGCKGKGAATFLRRPRRRLPSSQRR
jgi:hypothetical protein